MELQYSVVEELRRNNLYDKSGVLPQQDLITIRPDGTQMTHIMAQIDKKDISIFADELDIALLLQNKRVQSLYVKNAVAISQLIRVINYNTRSGFKGSVGAGNQLDAVQLRAEQFSDPLIVAITNRITWIRAVGAPGAAQFITAQDAGAVGLKAALTMAANEGLCILGFANPAAAPCNSAFSIQYLGVNYNVQNLSFEMADPFVGDPIIELKQPLVVYPGENFLMNIYNYQAGVDELRPIGIWVKTATNLRALATS